MTIPRCAASIAALVLVTTSATAAPTAISEKSADSAGGAVYIFLGRSGWNARELSTRLARAGFARLEENPGGGGIGLRFWTGRSAWTGGLELAGASDTASGPTSRVSLFAGQLTVQVGRVLMRAGPLRSYAMLGVGLGADTLHVDPIGRPPQPRNALGFADGGRGATNVALSLQGLVGLDYVVAFDRPVRGFDGLLFGLRAGVAAQPAVSSWSTSAGRPQDERDLDLPRVSAEGPFVHLVFGDVVGAR